MRENAMARAGDAIAMNDACWWRAAMDASMMMHNGTGSSLHQDLYKSMLGSIDYWSAYHESINHIDEVYSMHKEVS